MRNWKTTLIGAIALIAGLFSLYLVLQGQATLTEAGSYLALLLAFVIGVKAFFEKDHDKDNNKDVNMKKGPGGGGIKNPKP